MVFGIQRNHSKYYSYLLRRRGFLGRLRGRFGGGADGGCRADDVDARLHFVDTHEPVLCRVRFLQMFQLEVLVTDLNVTRPVVPGRRAEVKLYIIYTE